MSNDAPSRLLLVESDPEDRRALTNLLSASGFEVVSAVDYESAVKTMDSQLPRAVVVSTRLGGGPSGFVALRAFKSKGGEVAVALLPEDNFAEAVSAFRLGADDVLVKPPRAGEIVGVLRKELGVAPQLGEEIKNETTTADSGVEPEESQE